MINVSLADMYLVKSVKDNLHATVGTFGDDDLKLWDSMLKSNPDKFIDIALYGYKKRQEILAGRKEFSDAELKDFTREFIWKYHLMHVRDEDSMPSHYIDLNLFELSCQ